MSIRWLDEPWFRWPASKFTHVIEFPVLELGFEMWPGIPSGRFLLPRLSTVTQAIGAGTRHWVPIIVARAATFDRIGCRCTTLAASSIARLGLYADDGTGFPGALVVDAGTVTTDATGDRVASIDQSLSPGLYWTCVWVTGGAPTLVVGAHTGNAGASTMGIAQGSIDPGTTWSTGYIESGLTTDAALPSTAPNVAGNSSRWPVIAGLRAA